MNYLVQILPGEEGLVAVVGPQQGGEGVRLLALLPGGAAAVALQRVVDDVVVVRVLPRQDAGSTRAAQRAGHELEAGRERPVCQCLHRVFFHPLRLDEDEEDDDDTYSVCERYSCIANEFFRLGEGSLEGKYPLIRQQVPFLHFHKILVLRYYFICHNILNMFLF